MIETFQEWELLFYTKPLLEIVLCIAFVIAIKNRKKHSILKYMPIYVAVFLLIFLLTEARTLSAPKSTAYLWINAICEAVDYGSIAVELFIFSHMYCKIFDSPGFTRFVLIMNLAFLGFFFYELSIDPLFYIDITHETKAMVYTVEGILLLPLCLQYFINLFKKSTFSNLKEEPTFWISAGLFSFLACTLPYSILENFVPKRSFPLMYQFYFLFYLFYSIFFILIIKAFYCKPTNTVLSDELG
jgi:hypothetical protein